MIIKKAESRQASPVLAAQIAENKILTEKLFFKWFMNLTAN